MFEIIQGLLDDPSFQAKVKFVTRLFKANEQILKQGQQHQGIYLIKKGSVRIIVKSEISQDLPLRPGIADLSPNDIFGEFGLFDDLPASADVIATADSELIEIDIPTFKAFLDANPKIGYDIFFELLKILVKRLRHADKTIFNLYTWGMKAHQLDKHLE